MNDYLAAALWYGACVLIGYYLNDIFKALAWAVIKLLKL